jgi:hypothetical protein
MGEPWARSGLTVAGGIKDKNVDPNDFQTNEGAKHMAPSFVFRIGQCGLMIQQARPDVKGGAA